MLVLDAEDERSLAGAIGQLAQRRCDAIETRVGIDRAPVRKYPDDTSPHTLGDVERAARELRLIVEPECRAEHVLLDMRRDRRGIGQRAFQDRRCDREDTHAARFDLRPDRIDLCVGMLEDVPAVDDPKLGERHAELGHRPKRAIKIVR